MCLASENLVARAPRDNLQMGTPSCLKPARRFRSEESNMEFQP